MKTEDDKNQEPKPVVIKTAVDLQKMKLEKLMKNPEKPVLIPERQKEKKLPHVPEFVRNVMGSSAGAGSGEFHVYRHLRRKEYARQRYIQERGEKAMLDEAYEQKIIENKKMAEERTQKKRQKRLKKKAKKLKRNRSDKPNENSQGAQDNGDSTDKDSDNSDCEVSDNAK